MPSKRKICRVLERYKAEALSGRADMRHLRWLWSLPGLLANLTDGHNFLFNARIVDGRTPAQMTRHGRRRSRAAPSARHRIRKFPMTVCELIERLRSYDPNARVVVTGYENGYDDICEIKLITITPVADAKEWDGEFDDYENGEVAVHLKTRSPR
jgi:hypothetical protein